MTVNGRERSDDVEPRLLLASYLREVCGLRAANIGCDTTSCGACTVLVDGEPQRSCLMFAVQADGCSIETIEGLAGEELHPVQQAFHEAHGMQCGFCTPGFIMSLVALLRTNPDADDDELLDTLSGNLCRCTGYVNIVEAARLARERVNGGA
jgi:aerobic carbon-monoxide dehydrogenase small subunit